MQAQLDQGLEFYGDCQYFKSDGGVNEERCKQFCPHKQKFTHWKKQATLHRTNEVVSKADPAYMGSWFYM